MVESPYFFLCQEHLFIHVPVFMKYVYSISKIMLKLHYTITFRGFLKLFVISRLIRKDCNEQYDFDDDVRYGMSINSEIKVGCALRKVSAKPECFFVLISHQRDDQSWIDSLDSKSYMTYPSHFSKKISELCECVLTHAVELIKDCMKINIFLSISWSKHEIYLWPTMAL